MTAVKAISSSLCEASRLTEEQREAITWDDDYRDRVNPALVTELLRDAVPVLRYVGWKVTETAQGCAKTILPLCDASTNQHGTHQAALVALAADYTGGIALATLLRGIPILGVHPQPSDNGASLWLVSLHVTYRIPSTGDLLVSAQIDPAAFQRIREKYDSGEANIETVEIRLEVDGEQIATANLGYFIRQSKFLKPRSPDDRPCALFRHRTKTSARLVAGLRALENAQPNPRYQDPHSAVAAGAHGRLLAERFTILLPQLGEMVAARTKNIDDLLSRSMASGLRQVVLVGAGFDFRLFRIPRYGSRLTVYELDLPHMLAEREKLLRAITNSRPFERRAIAVNLELEDAGVALLKAGFDPALPSVIVCEGISMYFGESVNKRLLGSLHRLLGHSRSRLWIDAVARSVVVGTTGHAEVESFMRGMEKLGEPFTFGLDEPRAFFAELGYEVADAIPSSVYSVDTADPIFRLYSFYLLERASRCARSLRGSLSGRGARVVRRRSLL